MSKNLEKYFVAGAQPLIGCGAEFHSWNNNKFCNGTKWSDE